MNNIHSTAIVENGARLGENITIGAFSIIGKDVCLGDNCIVGSHTLIEGKTTLGKDNKIFSHAVIGSIPQDKKFAGEDVELIIGDANTIREHTLINPGTKGGGGKTIIGNKNLLMGHVHIGHDCILGDDIVVANSCAIAGHVEVGSFAVIGGMVAIHQFVQIGTGAMIGGGAIVIQDIPPYCLAEGNRASIRSLNITGLRRSKKREDIDEIKRGYKELVSSKKPLMDIAKNLYENSTNIYLKELAFFVLNTKRGVPFKKAKSIDGENR